MLHFKVHVSLNVVSVSISKTLVYPTLCTAVIVLSGAIHPYAESVLVVLQDQMGGLQCELDKARANCNLKHWWPVESFLITMIQQCREIRNVFFNGVLDWKNEDGVWDFLYCVAQVTPTGSWKLSCKSA